MTNDDDRLARARALRLKAELERRLPGGGAARERYEEAVAAFREVDEPLALAHTIRHLGDVHHAAGRAAQAEPCYREALDIYRRHPDAAPLDLANAIRSMAVLKAEAGESAEARRLWHEARDLYVAGGVAPGVAESASWLRRLTLLVALAAALCMLGSSYARAQRAPGWTDTFVSRLEALALIQTLNAEILGSTSATLTLETWCRDHQLAAEPVIVAHQVKGVDRTATAEQRQRLRVTVDERVNHRHVRLQCGALTLSEADNWYVPGRLTTDMNRRLETTDAPFGKVVQPLEPYRQTFAVKILWSPLPDGWDRAPRPSAPAAGAGALVIPDALFEHRAVLYTRDRQPFSEVDEVYQGQLLAFPQPLQER